MEFGTACLTHTTTRILSEIASKNCNVGIIYALFFAKKKKMNKSGIASVV